MARRVPTPQTCRHAHNIGCVKWICQIVITLPEDFAASARWAPLYGTATGTLSDSLFFAHKKHSAPGVSCGCRNPWTWHGHAARILRGARHLPGLWRISGGCSGAHVKTWAPTWVTSYKAKAHATILDVANRVTTWLHRTGNKTAERGEGGPSSVRSGRHSLCTLWTKWSSWPRRSFGDPAAVAKVRNEAWGPAREKF